MKRIWLFLVMVLCLAFAVRTLLLIDATALWSDELYSVGKSFQSSFTSMLAMLREDTHPPAYYALLWLWGHLVGQSPIGLRSLSWLAYLAGGMVMVRQAMALGPVDARVNVGTVAALLAFCSPYPVRFAIEGKSYAPFGFTGGLGLAVASFIPSHRLRRDGRACRNDSLLRIVSGIGCSGLGWLATPLELFCRRADRSPSGLGLDRVRRQLSIQLQGGQLDRFPGLCPF